MVNPDSDLFRAHPEWVLGVPGPSAAHEWRRQQVLDLAHPDAYDSRARAPRRAAGGVRHRLPQVGPQPRSRRGRLHFGGGRRVHGQTLALYRLLDELRARNPAVEIESCASGGGRVDLGILERTDRVWASDTNDALERQAIQRWTGLLLAARAASAPTSARGPRAHDRPLARALLPRRDRAVRPLRASNGTSTRRPRRTHDGLAECDRVLQAGARHLLHGGERRARRPPRPGRLGPRRRRRGRGGRGLRLRAARVRRDRGPRRGAAARAAARARLPGAAGHARGRAARRSRRSGRPGSTPGA